MVLLRNLVRAGHGSLLWAERYDELRLCSMRRSPRRRRPATAAGSRSGWPSAAGSPSDSVISPQPRWTLEPLAASELRAPALYRVLNGGVLVNALVEQGELDAAEAALAPFDGEIESDYLAAARSGSAAVVFDRPGSDRRRARRPSGCR